MAKHRYPYDADFSTIDSYQGDWTQLRHGGVFVYAQSGLSSAAVHRRVVTADREGYEMIWLHGHQLDPPRDSTVPRERPFARSGGRDG